MTSNIPKDIVDEREDLAIEQSLKDCETTELKHSYASALWQGEFVLGFLIEKKLTSVSHLELFCNDKHRNRN